MPKPFLARPYPADAGALALDRSMAPPQATSMVVGIIVGATIFVQPGEIGRHVPAIGGMVAVWLVAGFLTSSGALVCTIKCSNLRLPQRFWP